MAAVPTSDGKQNLTISETGGPWTILAVVVTE